jgi:hypothetical protein
MASVKCVRKRSRRRGGRTLTYQKNHISISTTVDDANVAAGDGLERRSTQDATIRCHVSHLDLPPPFPLDDEVERQLQVIRSYWQSQCFLPYTLTKSISTACPRETLLIAGRLKLWIKIKDPRGLTRKAIRRMLKRNRRRVLRLETNLDALTVKGPVILRIVIRQRPPIQGPFERGNGL